MPWFASAILILIIVSLEITLEGACSESDNFKAMEEMKAAGCFEFWFNRYQTLFGAILALIAAWIATIPARGQLREMARQSAASARAPMQQLAEALEQEALVYNEMDRFVYVIRPLLYDYDTENPHDLFKEWPDKWQKARILLEKLNDKVEFIAGRYPDHDGNAIVRKRCLDAGVRLSIAMYRLGKGFEDCTVGPCYESLEETINAAELREVREAIWVNMSNFRRSSSSAREQILISAKEAWVEVRKLEQRAFGR